MFDSLKVRKFLFMSDCYRLRDEFTIISSWPSIVDTETLSPVSLT